jgi:TPR repeat protein
MSTSDEFLAVYDLYMSGRYRDALPGLLAYARKGCVIAQFCLAGMYLNGEGVEQDIAQSEYWQNELLTLAKQGNVAAQNRLAFSYRFGDVFPLDIQEANFWLEAAARAGDHEAEYHLFIYQRDGNYGYEADPASAEYWLHRAAAGGYPDALWVTALRTMDQEGRPSEEGLRMIRVAAKAGFPPAQEFLRSQTH